MFVILSIPCRAKLPTFLFAGSQKVVGSAYIKRTRGSEISVYSETKPSSCSNDTRDAAATASYVWSLFSANDSTGGLSDFSLAPGRDPRVLTIPSDTLGFAGSTYVFQLNTALGDVHSSALVTGGCRTNLTCLGCLARCVNQQTNSSACQR